MQLIQKPGFRKAVKKLHGNQKKELDHAIEIIMNDPSIGERKIGDLAGIQVYKFKMVDQLTLLAYRYQEENITLILIMLGSHENFYRDLKR